MAEQRAKRRLAAILAADVVGYSRLMEADEAGTLAELRTRRKDLIEPLVAEHRGRIFKISGDGLLVEFASAVDALECAIAVQKGMSAANRQDTEERRVVLRIGVNLGDVMVEDDDLYGDGVNIAARLESIAEPGAILISGTAHDHVRKKVTGRFEDLGIRKLKNITEPIRIYQVADTPKVSSSSLKADAEKFSVVVLPFLNMSSDAEQEYFADGITEDIITELSRFKSLLVIARNSSFYYKGRSPPPQDIGSALGVRWIVEGSVRKADHRVRITAQLIDAETGAHVWAERYDRKLEAIFEVQDEVVQAIAAAIPGHLGRIAVEQARRKPTTNLTAFDHLLRGRWAIFHSADGLPTALKHLEAAIAADPDYAAAHAQIAAAYCYGIYVLGYQPEIAIDRARQHAGRAVALDGSDTEVNAAAGVAYITSGLHELADLHSARAMASNPNDPSALFSRGFALSYLGRPLEALEIFARMQRLDPLAPDDSRSEVLCDCYFMLGKYEKVLDLLSHRHDVPPYMRLIEAAAYAQLGRIAEATETIKVFQRSPGPKPDPATMIGSQMRMIAHIADRNRWLEGYRKAGLAV